MACIEKSWLPAEDYKLELGGQVVPRVEWAASGTQQHHSDAQDYMGFRCLGRHGWLFES